MFKKLKMSLDFFNCGSSDPNIPHLKASKRLFLDLQRSDWRESLAWLVEMLRSK